ncbi:MAG TPA: RagB/SusD family nutrient uptake outer membrane protein, partial [Chitinophagaceae bacterium]|nr:RagB/SusD family nutrient uptake outer membrane protein [Chitinophagaceae bacterium]
MKKYRMLRFQGRLWVIALFAVLSLGGTSCKKYLDIVPDNIATIDNAFTLRSTAERYLVTCYSFIPPESDLPYSTLLSGDELWLPIDPLPTYEFVADESWGIALGRQNVNAPLLDYWNGPLGISGLWEGIRDCNIFLEHIMKVPGMTNVEKKQWAAEAKFLKAYYHFSLLRMYGPIPVIKANLPISASIDEVKVQRQPVDSVFGYIVQLLNEAAADLPVRVIDENQDLGRATKLVALSLKAKVLVYEASPLFNGNKDYAGFDNKDGTPLFPAGVSLQKWKDAADACHDAIQACESAGYSLYHFSPTARAQNLSKETTTKLNIRNIITERWNTEIIWANPNSTTVFLQRQ